MGHICNECGETLSSARRLATHKASSRCKKPFSCADCKGKYVSEANLKRHVCAAKKTRELKVRIKMALQEARQLRQGGLGGLDTEFYDSGWTIEEMEYVLEKVPAATEELISLVVGESDTSDIVSKKERIDRSDVHWFSKSKNEIDEELQELEEQEEQEEQQEQEEIIPNQVMSESSDESSEKPIKPKPNARQTYEQALKLNEMFLKNGQPPVKNLEELRLAAEKENPLQTTTVKATNVKATNVFNASSKTKEIKTKEIKTIEQLDFSDSDSSEEDEAITRNSGLRSSFVSNHTPLQTRKYLSDQSDRTIEKSEIEVHREGLRSFSHKVEQDLLSIIDNDRQAEKESYQSELNALSKTSTKPKNKRIDHWETKEYEEEITERTKCSKDPNYQSSKLLITEENYNEPIIKCSSTSKSSQKFPFNNSNGYITNVIRESSKIQEHAWDPHQESEEGAIEYIDAETGLPISDGVEAQTFNDLMDELELDIEKIKQNYNAHPPIPKKHKDFNIPMIHRGHYLFCIKDLMSSETTMYDVLYYIRTLAIAEDYKESDFRLLKKLYMTGRTKSEIPFKVLDKKRLRYAFLDENKVWITDEKGLKLGEILANNLIDTYVISNIKLQNITVNIPDEDFKEGLLTTYRFDRSQDHIKKLYSAPYQQKLIGKLISYVSILSDGEVVK